MDRSIADLAAKLAGLERQIRTLATAARANKTDVRDGYTRWILGDNDYPQVRIGSVREGTDVALEVLDAAGNQQIYVGSSDGNPRINVENPDRTARLVNVIEGAMNKPLLTSGWQRHPQAAMNSTNGFSTTTSASFDQILWNSIITLTSDRGRATFYVNLGAGVTSVDVEVRAIPSLEDRPGFVGQTQVVGSATGVAATGLQQMTLEYPASLWAPDSHPAGTVAALNVYARVASGAGTVGIHPYGPLLNLGEDGAPPP